MGATIQRAATPSLRACPSCREGRLHEATHERVFRPHGKAVVVQLLTSKCDHCGAEAPSAAQHQENLRRLAARKPHYGELLMGQEILALRRKYGLTQQQASQIFGKGKIAFSRYESETTFPDESTTRLLTLAIEKPDVLRWLADRAGVDIPLWRQRCEDSRMAIRPIPDRVAQVAVKRRLDFHTPDGDALVSKNGWRQVSVRAHPPRLETTKTRLQEFREAA
ncbi:MAG TPA: type II toxin-antitoxin system MqsA family antitoxin [Rubrivivax sp.]|nr:type II toxin-antitoxin system MqsA family antitoxin [Rubrivivax sp.]